MAAFQQDHYSRQYSNVDQMMHREQSRTVVSSQVIDSSFLGEAPQQDAIRYVEVPVYEEVIKHVPVREVIEYEKRVPRVEIQWVDRVVEVPQIQCVDKHVEIEQIQEVIRHVPRRVVQDRPVEVVRHVPRIETVAVEKIIEVPGQIIEVPKPYTVENQVTVPRYVDKEVPVLVAQTVRPTVVETDEFVDVDVLEYEPFVQVVDVHLAKPVSSQVLAGGSVEEYHQIVQLPSAQYNTMVNMLNTHITDKSVLPYITENGMTPFAPDVPLVTPKAVEIAGYSGLALPPQHYQGTPRVPSLGHDFNGDFIRSGEFAPASFRGSISNNYIPRSGSQVADYTRSSRKYNKQVVAKKRQGCMC